ncbi:hypothetical protein ACWEO2_39405 [Nocardia sp. NPDC004278]
MFARRAFDGLEDEVRPIRGDIAARVENLRTDLGLPVVDRLRS